MPKIIIRNLTRRRIPAVYLIKRTIKKVLELEKRPPLGLGVVYVNDARIRRLNLKYRNRDSSTDVLVFRIKEGKPIQGQDRFLGDVVISLDAAERQAKYFRSTKDKELKLYLIHGLLHLVGYDDEKPSSLKKMKRRQEELFSKV